MPEDLVRLVDPADVRGYAVATGWRRLDGVNGQIAVYNHPDSDLDQLIVPLNPDVDGYGRNIADVVSNLAGREARPSLEVLNDLLLSPGSDILRFRVEDSD